jgi:putative ABC transport system permease protein
MEERAPARANGPRPNDPVTGRTEPQPPQAALLLLRVILRGEAREVVTGDLLEEFAARSRSGSTEGSPHSWFWRQALSSVRARLGRPTWGPKRRTTREGRRGPLSLLGGGGLGHDFRFALRGLRRRPGFAALATATIAIGVGATTSVFSYANWTLLKPLPGVSTSPDRLAIVEYRDGIQGTGISYPNILDLDAGAAAVERLVAASGDEFQISGPGFEPFFTEGTAITRGYFEALGVRVQRGRLFTEAELRPEATPALAVVSHRLWTEQLRSDPSVIGRELTINGIPLTVIGVTGVGFAGHRRITPVDVWVPAGLYPVLRHTNVSVTDRSRGNFMENVALLAPGASVAQAESQLREVMARLIEAYPDENEAYVENSPTVFAGVGTPARSRSGEWEMVGIMSAIALLVLVVACANNANLLFSRVVARRGETAVRRSLGASRARLVRQNLVEALLLALCGGALAWGVAAGLNRVFTADLSLGAGVPVDARVLVFALATAVTVPMMTALLPSWLASRVDVARQLPGAGSFSVARKALVRSTLTVIQLSLSLALLVGSLLMIRSLANLRQVEVGFDPSDLAVTFVDPGPQGYTQEEATAFQLDLLARAKELRGVEAATVAYSEPFDVNLVIRLRPAGASEAGEVRVGTDNVGPDYFRTLGIPLVQGRDFRAEEMALGVAADEAVILNQTAARSLFGTVDAVGRSVAFRDREMRVIGVVGDVRNGFRDAPAARLYHPLPGKVLNPQTEIKLMLRSSRPAEELAAELRGVVTGLDANVPIYLTMSLSRLMAQNLAEERVIARLLTTLALLASTLAAIGLFAVVRWGVAERTREIGLRIALGSPPAGVVRLVTRQAAAFALVGIVLGWAASIGVAHMLRSTLFGVEPFDPTSWGLAAILLFAVALLAACQPAFAAARVHPAQALRHD